MAQFPVLVLTVSKRQLRKILGKSSWRPFTYLAAPLKKISFSVEGVPPQCAHLSQEPATTAAAWQLLAGEGNCLE